MTWQSSYNVRNPTNTPWHPSLTVTHSLSLVPLLNHIPSLLYLLLVSSGVSKSYGKYMCSRRHLRLLDKLYTYVHLFVL
jgi:hypothetical protein